MSFLILAIVFLSFGAAHASTLNRDTGKTTLVISAKVNTAGAASILAKDQARAQFLKDVSLRPTGTGQVNGNISKGVLFYTAEVGIGTPPDFHTLLVDTGSSNTWVGAHQSYIVTKSSVNTNNSVYVRYDSGIFYGEEWLDDVTLAPNLVVNQQSIGIANLTEGITDADGILGLGPADLTNNTVSNTFEVPTVVDNLYTQRKISQEVFGVFLAPASGTRNNGTLTFGGYDESVTTSSVNYISLTTTTPAARYWGINQTISYGEISILASTAGIIDTGTAFILIPTDAFMQYEKYTGATLDSTTGLLTITVAQYAKLQTLWFNIGGVSHGLTPNAQIWPRSLNTAVGGKSDAIYLIINDIGHPSGSGLDFVNGYSFLQRFYSVYDTANKRFGIARTIYTNSNTN